MKVRNDFDALLRGLDCFYRGVAFVGWMLAVAAVVAVMVAAGVSPGMVAVALMALAFAGVIAADLGRRRPPRPPPGA